jgi:hypothetical protein
MPPTLTVDEVTSLLLDIRDFDNPLREKELHKLLYFIKHGLQEEGIDADIPYFWYRYGTMAKLSDAETSIAQTDDGTAVQCPVTPASLTLDESTVDKAKMVVSQEFSRYLQEGGVEGITDRQYEDAPYEVQRHYREMDKQLRTATDEHPDFMEEGYGPDSVRRSLSRVVKSFPTDEFPELEDDLYLWYGVMSTELDEERYKPETLLSISDTFWTIFSIELAQREHSDMTVEEVRDEISDDVDEYKARLRETLRNREREQTEFGPTLEEDEVVRELSDAVSESLLGFPVS